METKAMKLARLFEENKPEDLNLNDPYDFGALPKFEVLPDGGVRIHYVNHLATTASKWRVVDLDKDQAVELALWMKKNYLPHDLKRVK